jgi:aminoglycoside phosphotransferase (APT) family kinase protein
MLKVSASPLDGQMKQHYVESLPFVPKIHSSGVFTVSGGNYHYFITDYVEGCDLCGEVQYLTEKEQYEIGKEIVFFLDKLHTITDDCYDIGHYVPSIPRCKKSWKEGHLEYISLLESGIAQMDIESSGQKAVSSAFDYIYANIDTLEYQTGAKLLHNDFHPKNIIIREGKLAGIIDWECSQYGEADFEFTHLFHWCIYPPKQENNFEVLLKSVVENSLTFSKTPNIEKRITIYQLEHEINQVIWAGRAQEERIYRIYGWLNGRIDDFC